MSTAAARSAREAAVIPLREQLGRLPRHIAIVMDGNGRWAQQRGKPRSFGHRAGQKAVRATVEFCLREGIESLTLFAFSSENWRRPETEISALMELFLRALDREVKSLHKNNVRLRFIGDVDAFQANLRERMQRAEAQTAANTALALNIAVSYGGRQDIVRACQQLIADVAAGRQSVEAIDEAALHARTALADQPPLDLFIRTGGEHRVSNFLLWQLAYAELYFTDVLWPDVGADLLRIACADFASRERRFGQTSAQVRT